MSIDPIHRAGHLLRPLRFACKDNFANLPRMVELGTLCAGMLKEIAEALRDEAAKEASELALTFGRFDTLPLAQKRGLILQGLAFAHRLRGETFSEYNYPNIETGKQAPPIEERKPTEILSQKIPASGNKTALSPGSAVASEKKGKPLEPPSEDASPRRRPPPLSLSPEDPIEKLGGVGQKSAKHLKAAGLHTIGDLLALTPRKYLDLRGTLPVSLQKTPASSPLSSSAEGSVTGRVRSCRVIFARGKRGLKAEVEIPGEGVVVHAYFFRIPPGYGQRFSPGSWVTLAGKMTLGSGGPQMAHPKVKFHGAQPPLPENRGGEIEVIYPEVEGIPQKTLARLVRTATEQAASRVEDHLPDELRRELGLLSLAEALKQVHAPSPSVPAEEVLALQEGKHPARRRLAFDEIFALQLGLALRASRTKKEEAFAVPPSKDPVKELSALVPFTLTRAQKRAIEEIAGDISQKTPMNRILIGEVGSGKTAVALGAALPVLEAGMQVALMAPTEILAVQHAERLLPLVRRAGHEVALILGGSTKSGRTSRVAAAAGMAGLVVGTHALLEDAVTFRRLALAIIDEQHRFGVEQRARLMQKGGLRPHLLVMSATPIPRTLALTLYGDLELSVLDELPPGRKPVKTQIFSFEENERLWGEVEAELSLGGQVFVICPLVDRSESIDAPDATRTAKELQARFPQRRVGLLHGRLSAEERGQVMRSFARGLCDILVATTVVEVGVDVPNATLMVILGAERFGLSQLHQLRGRVGRGKREARCFLMGGPEAAGGEARARLRALVNCHDGFRLAEEDLRLRGPGEFLGTRQSGAPDSAMAELFRDAALLGRARTAARTIIARDPTLSQKEFLGLRKVVSRRLGAWVEALLS